MEEIWKDIEGFEGYYQVSNFGKVRSLDRIIKNGETSTYLKRGMMLKQFVDSTGAYWMVSLVKNNKSSTKSVHRLVAKAFIPNPDNKPQVGHKDEKTLKNSGECNNHVDNLEWVTSSENTRHAIKNNHLVAWGNEPKPIVATKLDDGATLEFESIRQAEVVLDTRHIVDVLKGKRASAKGYTFACREEVMPDDHFENRRA